MSEPRARELVDKISHSEYLTSPIIEVTVGAEDNVKTFRLHQSLLERNSKRISTGLKDHFVEAKTGTYDFPEENPVLFGYFVEFLYWIDPPIDLEVITLVRLYNLGERLVSTQFKSIMIDRVWKKLTGNPRVSLTDIDVCDLLELIAEELHDSKTDEDPMRTIILSYAAGRLSNLKKLDRFENLLWDYPDLGRGLVMKASDAHRMPERNAAGKFTF